MTSQANRELRAARDRATVDSLLAELVPTASAAVDVAQRHGADAYELAFALTPPPDRVPPRWSVGAALAGLALTGITLAAPAEARDWWVSTTGSDTAGGSSTAPLRTIRKASSVVLPGDVVRVRPGTYNEDLLTSRDGTAAARIIYKSETKWGADIVGAGAQIVWENKADYITIQGFEVTGANAREGIFNDGSHVRIVENHVHHVLAPGCRTTNQGGTGIGSAGGNYDATDVQINRNFVHHIGPQTAPYCTLIHGIYPAHDNMRVTNNIVCKAYYGFHMWHAPSNIDLVNNVSIANLYGGMVIGAGDAPGGVVTHDIRAINNIIYGNPGVGIVESGAKGPRIEFYNNLVYGNGTNWNVEAGRVRVGTVTAPPGFVNYLATCNGDYRLAATSPAVDVGSSLSPASIDFAGAARPLGGGYDIGAYER